MKRKFVSVLLALVLVLSFSMVTAAPVAADPSPDYAAVTFAQGGTGTAEWSTTYARTESYSVRLYAPVYDSETWPEYGKVTMPLDMAFDDAFDFSVYVEGGAEAAQALPLLDIKAVIDDAAGVSLPLSNKDTGGVTIDDGKILVLASQPGQSEGLSVTLMSDGIDGWEQYGTHSGAAINVGSGTEEYWSIFVYSAGYTYETAYDYYTWDEIHTALDGKATVIEVRVELITPQATNGEGGVDVESTVYVDDILINGDTYDLEPRVINTDTAEGFNTIQAAIDDEDTVSGHIISVADGIYDAETFPITVDVANLTIESVSGAASTTIDSGDTSGRVIAISAAGVTIGGTDKGFRIEGEGAVADGLIYIGANDATITENHFVGDYYLMVLGPGVSGAMVEDNIFLPLTSTEAAEVLGIYVNNDVTASTFDGNSFPTTESKHVDSGIYLAPGATADQTITISNNTFEGMGLRDGGTKGCGVIELDGVGGITIESNTIVDCNDGIYLRGVNALTGDVTIQSNTITGNVWGIEVKDGVGTVGTITANYNNIVGNTTYGVQNTGTAELDAENNWWGNASGPIPNVAVLYISYGDKVSTNVDYQPWLLEEVVSGEPLPETFDKTLALKDGWTLVSTNKAVAANTTWVGTTLEYKYALDPVSGELDFLDPTVTDLVPVSALYLKTAGGGGVGIDYSTSAPGVSGKMLLTGWNLISGATTDTEIPASAILSPLAVVAIGEDMGPGLATFASQGGYNQYAPSRFIPTLTEAGWNALSEFPLNPFDGYWVYMNAAKSFGVIPD